MGDIVKGRNFEELYKGNSGVNIRIRPRAAKLQAQFPLRFPSSNLQTDSDDLVRRNLNTYLSNFLNLQPDRKQQGACCASLCECPLLKKYQETLRKSRSDHDRLINSLTVEGYSFKSRHHLEDTENMSSKMAGQKSLEKPNNIKKNGRSKTLGTIRSTRAQDLRLQSNRHLLNPKNSEKPEDTRIISPYAVTKKGVSNTTTPSTRPSLGKPSAEKKSTSKTYEKAASDRSKPEVSRLKETKKPLQRTKKEAGDAFNLPGLKKSHTFVICKGPRNGEGDERLKLKLSSKSDESDPEENPDFSPQVKPLTHNDSFCLIAKSSKSWSLKPKSERALPIDTTPRKKKTTTKRDDKGILKNHAVEKPEFEEKTDAEKTEGEKAVRFSDEGKRKTVRTVVRRKRRMQNGFTCVFYRKNKLFQKQLEFLKSKSVLHMSPASTPDVLKPFQFPAFLKERYEAEMLGLIPRQAVFVDKIDD